MFQINWTELIHTITGVQLTPNTELQVYFEDQLIRALKSLEKFHELYELNNALLGLYAKNLYEQVNNLYHKYLNNHFSLTINICFGYSSLNLKHLEI